MALEIPLPPELLEAITAPAGGRVAIVVRAGCSSEEPTALPLARELSEEAARRLIGDGILVESDITDPSDLSAVADAVWLRTGSQEQLVRRLPRDTFQMAQANEGYLTAAALLREQAVADLLTLNFDLAVRNGLVVVGSRGEVSVVVRARNLDQISTCNVIHLHGDVNSEVNDWVLRTDQLKQEWRSEWEEVMSTRVMSAPVVVFAGLGSRAAVLVETVAKIRAAIENVTIMVDPGPFGTSDFAAAVGVDESKYVQCGWSDFMRRLGKRVAAEQLARLRSKYQRSVTEQGLPMEEAEPILRDFGELDLLELGSIRSRWLLSYDTYVPERTETTGHLVTLTHVVAAILRILAGDCTLNSNGDVVVTKDESAICILVPVSGAGVVRWAALEARLASVKRLERGKQFGAVVVLAAGMEGPRDISVPSQLIPPGAPDSVARPVREPVIMDSVEVLSNPDAFRAQIGI